MRTVNIHEAKTQLSRLLAATAEGESIIIAKAGTPIARLVPLEAHNKTQSRVGFMADLAEVPDDFDTMDAEAIAEQFGMNK